MAPFDRRTHLAKPGDVEEGMLESSCGRVSLVRLHRIPFLSPVPALLESAPTTFWLVSHTHLVHNEVIRTISWSLSLAHVAAHCDVDYDLEIPPKSYQHPSSEALREAARYLHSPRPFRHRRFHHWSPIDPPEKATLAVLLILIPRELVLNCSSRHVADMCADDAMLPGVLRRIMAL